MSLPVVIIAIIICAMCQSTAYSIEHVALLNQITRNIREDHDIQSLLQTTIAQVTQMFNADQSFMYLVQDESSQNGDRLAEIITATPDDLSFTQKLKAGVQPLVLDHYAHEPIYALADLNGSGETAQQTSCLLSLGFQSALIAPVFIQQEFWGLVFVVHEQPRAWQDYEMHLLEQVAMQIGIALQQAMLNTQLELAHQQLRQAVDMDGLTQISNHRQFTETLQQEWRRMRRDQSPLSIILCDVDYFKRFNDEYGNQAGDDCLIQVAATLKSILKRPADSVARYGGDRFAIMLPNTMLTGACKIAEDVRRQVEALNIAHQSSLSGCAVTLSLGVASLIPQDHASPETLLQEAVDTLEEAKKNGRNQWLASGLEAALQTVFS